MNTKDTEQGQPLTQAEKDKIVRSTRRTDLRNIIGGLFVVYGIIVTATGLTHSVAELEQTGGIHINLWTGLSMLVAGILFFLWSRFAPVPAEDILSNFENIDEKIAEGESSPAAQ